MSDQSIVLVKIAMGRYPAVDVVVPFSLLPEICTYYYQKDDAISYISDGAIKLEVPDPANAIYISDLEEDDQYFSMLLVRGDPGRALPGFVNPALRTVKTAKTEEPGYVPGGSCHLVISKAEVTKGFDAGRHRAAMQKTRGIGRSLVRDFLAQLLARFVDEYPERFTAQKKRKNKKEKPEDVLYRPTVKFVAQENASLKKDLEDGRIGGFKLTRGVTTFTGAADEPNVQRINVQLHAQISPTENLATVSKLISRVREAVKNVSFESLNLELIDESGELSATQAIGVDDLGDSDLRYSKTVPIPVDSASDDECHSEFFGPTKKFAISCLVREEYWK